MTDAAAAAEAPPGLIERLTSAVAVVGGCLALGVAVLVCVSVLGRWLFSAPVNGDFEYVQMATAVAVFTYLPYTQLRRGNIMVDTFTGWLPARSTALIDAFWDFVFAACMAFCAAGLFEGALEAWRSGQTTMQVQIILWPVIALSGLLCALVASVSVLTALRLLARAPERTSP
jgi:TRAP-type C4-dicarboxylate transport system permease small subunit